jgi:DNA gyrase subunit A
MPVTKLFVASTHTPVLFFSTHGKVYRLKVWRLPRCAPGARPPDGEPASARRGETISTVLPLPEDEAEWKNLHIMFATAKGIVRPQQHGRLHARADRRQDRDALRRDGGDRGRHRPLIGVTAHGRG